MPYNLQMENDETLKEFVQILSRINELVGDSTSTNDEDINLPAAVDRLRLSGKNDDADELTELCERADELKAMHQGPS